MIVRQMLPGMGEQAHRKYEGLEMMVRVLFECYAVIRKRVDPGDERDGISDKVKENALDD